MNRQSLGSALVLLSCLFAIGLIVGCHGGKGTQLSSQSSRAIYHWKTTFNPSPWERQFLKDHHVTRIYLHLFDVVPNGEGNDVVPVATTRFVQLPDSELEIVPTVYVSREAFDMGVNMGVLADHIYDRIAAMMRHHGITYHEIQLDCDGGSSARFSTCQLTDRLYKRAHDDSLALSVTLRLSQLNDPHSLPNCDRYVLMLYNTGALQNRTTRNSILDYDDVQPYLRHVSRHWVDSLTTAGKHVDCAYPLYGWGVLFHASGQFARLVPVGQLPEKSNDSLRVEWGELSEIAQVQEAVNAKLAPRHQRATVLFHLDSACLAHYSFNDVETILTK